jgi:hypothetical protein
MNVLAILEVAIGIIFVWFLLGMLVSTVQEAIANVLQWRGKDLEQAIHRLLEDPATQKKMEIPLDGTATQSWVSRWFRRILRRPQPAYARVSQFGGPTPAGASVGGSTSPALENSFTTAETGIAPSGVATAGPMSAAASMAAGLGIKFYAHPLITTLSRDINKHKPSYIPTAQFAEVVLDLIVDAGSSKSPLRKAAEQAEKDLEDVKEETRHAATKAWQVLLKRVERIPAGTAVDPALAKAIGDEAAELVERYPFLEPGVQQLKRAIGFPPLLAQLGAGVESLAEGSPRLARSLEILITRAIENTRDADEALAKARSNVEVWFDSSMQRVSGAYKRRVQKWAFCIGLAVAILLHVDSIAILRSLSSDPSVRAVIAVQAQEAVQAGAQNGEQPTTQQILNQLSSLRLPIGWKMVANPDGACTHYYGAALSSLFHMNRCAYPAGYDAKAAPYTATFGETLLGMLITAIAAMQGSPFWFGVLSKIVNLRTSTSPPSTTTAQK